MGSADIKRLPRLTAILTQLQTKRLVTSTELAKKFAVSTRTIYRDIKALEQSGVPIITEEGKGYTIMEGYKIPPVMFTENEAMALITVEQLVLKNKDSSLIKEYSEAVNKIKAVLKTVTKDKTEILAKRIIVKPQIKNDTSSSHLIEIQNALTDYKVLEVTYKSESKNEITKRHIEPFAIYHNPSENWTLIAFCLLRKEFRLFRTDRIIHLTDTNKHFTPHKITLQEYLEEARKKYFNTSDKQLS